MRISDWSSDVCSSDLSVFSSADKHRIDLAAVVGAGMWLLHPLFVSTTLYIVQREAMLPATFTLLGSLAWLHGREAITQGNNCRGLAWIAVGLGGCTALGVLSKARSEEHTSELQSLMRISYAVFCLK